MQVYVLHLAIPDALANNKENNNCGEDKAGLFTSLFQKRELTPKKKSIIGCRESFAGSSILINLVNYF